LVYSENGAPVDVVRLETFETPTTALSDTSVIVRMLMSPVNPADLNTVQGAYAIRPDLPAVGGGEGVGVVDAVGRDVRNLRPGDWVLPSGNMQGTWTTHLEVNEDQLVKVGHIKFLKCSIISVIHSFLFAAKCHSQLTIW
jgi:trans-2-enoyl-CoA reductase